jgi:hypothetical protein
MRVADRVHKYFFNNGLLTPQANRERFLKRKNEIDRAVVAESARWGDAKRSTPLTREDWLAAVNQVLNYFNSRSGIVLDQLKNDQLYPNAVAPTFSKHGGLFSEQMLLSINQPGGTVYYTTDGTDPRLPGGAVSQSAKIYSGGSVDLKESATVKARALNGGEWSALNEADFFRAQAAPGLVISEIMYHPPNIGAVNGDEFEFLELYNSSSTTLDLSGAAFTNGITYTFPMGSTIAPQGYLLLVSNPTAFANKYPGVRFHGTYSGQLSDAGERLTLIHANKAVLLTFDYGDAAPWPVTPDGFGFSLVLRNPANTPDIDLAVSWRASTRSGGSPGTADPAPTIAEVLVNEVLTHTDPPAIDSIEISNPTPSAVDISHWYLSDAKGTPRKFKIPANTVLQPGGYVVFTETQFNAPSAGLNGFALSSHGEDIYLFSADESGNLTGYSHGISVGAAENNVSFGRHVTSDGKVHYVAQRQNTFGSANAGPKVGPIVIDEFVPAPATGSDEFIELFNITGSTVNLFDPAFPTNTWRIGGVNFNFPQGSTLEANSRALIVPIAPATFRTKYNIPATVKVFGPYTGNLQDTGEELSLYKPDAPDVGTNGVVTVPYILVDRVDYSNEAPWPSNLAGQSLQRINAQAFGDEPANWRVLTQATPGAAPATTRPTYSTWAAQHFNSSELANPAVSGEQADPDQDGASNYAEFISGTNPRSGAEFLALRTTLEGANLAFSFNAVSGRTYTLQSTDSLLPGAVWRDEQTVRATTTGQSSFTLPQPSGATSRYYRVKVTAD